MCPLQPHSIDPSVLIGATGVGALFVPVVGEVEMGAALGALGEAALARGLAAALPVIAKFIGDGFSRNPNGPADTMGWRIARSIVSETNSSTAHDDFLSTRPR